jgi:hypothetical protein
MFTPSPCFQDALETKKFRFSAAPRHTETKELTPHQNASFFSIYDSIRDKYQAHPRAASLTNRSYSLRVRFIVTGFIATDRAPRVGPAGFSPVADAASSNSLCCRQGSVWRDLSGLGVSLLPTDGKTRARFALGGSPYGRGHSIQHERYG